MSDETEPTQRAKELLVYGPLGLALYLRDTAPSFMKVFVARGRAEFDQQRRTVGDQLGQARSVGETTTDETAPQFLRLVSEGIERLRETAESALGTLSGWAGESVSWSSSPETGTPETGTSETGTPETGPQDDSGDAPGSGPTPDATSRDPGGAEAASPDPEPVVIETDIPNGAPLAIPAYDELSASQVVDRLEGLSTADLEAIRRHESAHRRRATILAKIDQLTHPA